MVADGCGMLRGREIGGMVSSVGWVFLAWPGFERVGWRVGWRFLCVDSSNLTSQLKKDLRVQYPWNLGQFLNSSA